MTRFTFREAAQAVADMAAFDGSLTESIADRIGIFIDLVCDMGLNLEPVSVGLIAYYLSIDPQSVRSTLRSDDRFVSVDNQFLWITAHMYEKMVKDS